MSGLRIVKQGERSGATFYVDDKEIKYVTGYSIETDVGQYSMHKVVLTLMVQDVTIEQEQQPAVTISSSAPLSSPDELARIISDRMKRSRCTP